MKNVSVVVAANIMTITVDLNKEFGMSASGKNTIIASSEGNVQVDEVTLGLNVYKKK